MDLPIYGLIVAISKREEDTINEQVDLCYETREITDHWQKRAFFPPYLSQFCGLYFPQQACTKKQRRLIS
jgi:hypothetical protein